MSGVSKGLDAFGEDAGTLWAEPDSLPMPLTELQKTRRHWQRALTKRLAGRPLVWFVDDERANREWFVERHRPHFALITFSSRRHTSAALQAKTPCDAVVTDLFFPANFPRNDNQANELLALYGEIKRSTVSGLANLWSSRKNAWSLGGFDIARDVADYAVNRKELIPVILFSRKAPLLLGSADWLFSPSSTVENTHWMLEKLDPSETGEAASRAARIQRDRISAVLRYRREATPWWKRQLGHLSVGWGPFRFSLPPAGKEWERA